MPQNQVSFRRDPAAVAVATLALLPLHLVSEAQGQAPAAAGGRVRKAMADVVRIARTPNDVIVSDAMIHDVHHTVREFDGKG